METPSPANWNSLPDIDLISSSLTKEDESCLNEIKEILVKHKKAHLFGVTLLHKHFDLNEDEVFIETHDNENRSLFLKPGKISKIEEQKSLYRPTTWRFDENGIMTYTFCPGASLKGDIISHYGYKDDY